MIAVFVNTAILAKDTDSKTCDFLEINGCADSLFLAVILIRMFLPGCYSVASSNIYSFWYLAKSYNQNILHTCHFRIPFLIFEGIFCLKVIGGFTE
jgi:hypothetical protein